MRRSFQLIGSAVCLSASAMLASCCCSGSSCCEPNAPANTYPPGQKQPLFPLLPNGATQQQKDDAIFKNTRVTAKTFDADGIKINYCEGRYNMDAPGRPTVLVFLHGVGERGSDNKSHLRYGFAEIVSYILAAVPGDRRLGQQRPARRRRHHPSGKRLRQPAEAGPCEDEGVRRRSHAHLCDRVFHGRPRRGRARGPQQ